MINETEISIINKVLYVVTAIALVVIALDIFNWRA